MGFVELLVVEPIGGLRGLLTVVGTLVFVGLCFVVVELIDRPVDSVAPPRGGRSRPVATRQGAGELAADQPADDIWPLRGTDTGTLAAGVVRSSPSSTTSLVAAAAGSVVAVVLALAMIPLREFHIAETSDVVTSILMIVIGISVGEVAVRTFRSRTGDTR